MMRVEKDITIISNSKIGEKRSCNQDDVLILETNKYRLFFLFDGVSSMNSSFVFICKCKIFILKNFKKYFSKEIKLAQLMYDTHMFALQQTINGMSTCSAIYLPKYQGESVIFNIGDSRIYDFTNQYLVSVTKDDSLPNVRNVLTKSLGGQNLTENDFFQTKFNFSFGFLLCSDGFYNLMESEKLKYFNIFNFKKGGNIIRSINLRQKGLNWDDSTYILIKKNGI